MKHFAAATALFLGFASVALEIDHDGTVSAAGVDENAYFESLTRRADLWKAYSLRDPAQLRNMKDGGYIRASGTPEFTTYSPDTDTNRVRQDATKVIVPAFEVTTTLTRAVNSSETLLTLADGSKPLFPVDRVFKVDREVMTVVNWVSDTTINVKRGAFSTAPATHAVGAVLSRSTNSAPNQIRLPLGTEDGHSYFFTWDGYWTDSYVGAGKFQHKAFQFSSGSQDGDAIFLEPDAGYGDDQDSCYDPSVHIATFRVRSYNTVGGPANWLLSDGNTTGPGVKNNGPLDRSGLFCMKPNTWNRFFLALRQRQNDYDYIDMWVADETNEPVQVLTNLPISVRPTGSHPNSIQKFWVEFNSSQDMLFRTDGRDLVSYVRNFVALLDPSDTRPLLVRPVPGAQAVSGVAAPRNVRIIPGS